MTTGTVLSIDPSGTTGQVQVDEMAETLPFNDLSFPSSGLTATPPNNACMFDVFQKIDPETGQTISYATNLKVATTPTTQTINGPYTGDLTAATGKVIIITTAAAIVTGDITVSGGKVVIDQSALVNGNINISAGGIVAIKGKGTILPQGVFLQRPAGIAGHGANREDPPLT